MTVGLDHIEQHLVQGNVATNNHKKLMETFLLTSNIRSLDRNFDELCKLTHQLKPKIIALQEIWQPKLSNHIKGYKLLKKERNSRGGGVAFYVKSEYVCKESFQMQKSVEIFLI